MKTMKKSLSVLLALVMAFSSVSLLSALALDTYNWTSEVKFFRQDRDESGNVIEGEWVEANGRVMPGEKVKARFFFQTEFAVGGAQFLFFYPTDFLTHDTSEYTSASTGYNPLINPDSKAAANSSGGYYTTGTDNSGAFGGQVAEGIIDASAIEGKGWIFAFMNRGTSAIAYNDGQWWFEFNFVVNETLPENADGTLNAKGLCYIEPECVADYYDKYFGATVVHVVPSGEGGKFTGGFDSCDDLDYDADVLPVYADQEGTESILSSIKTNITFDANGGKFDDGETSKTVTDYISYEKSVDAPADPEYTGGEFVGWVPADVEKPTADDVVDIATVKYEHDDLAFKALYALEKGATVVVNYTDVITGQPATETLPVASTEGYTVKLVPVLPEVLEEKVTYVTYAQLPAVANYKFDSANAANEFEVLVNAEGTSVLNVQYIPVEYTATFDAGAGSWADDKKTETITDDYYTEVNAPTAPTRTGYEFTGWLGSDGSNLKDAGAFRLEKDITYTAQYKSAATTVSVVVKYNDLANGGEEVTVSAGTVNTTAGYTVALAEADDNAENKDYFLISELPEIQHYEYDATKAVAPVTAAADGTSELVVYYAPVDYTVSFGATDVTDAYYTTIQAPDGPAEEGKTFKHWLAEDGATYVKGADYVIKGDASLTAIYDDNTYYATYSFKGTEGVDYPEDVTVAQTSGKMGDLIDLTEPTATGWTFEGWKVSNAATNDAGEAVFAAQDATVVGTWTHNEYTVTYKFETDIGEYVEYPYSQTYYYGEVIELFEAPLAEELPAGYEFIEWNCDYITMPDENIEVIGTLQQIEYTITVNFTDIECGTTQIIRYYGEQVTLADVEDELANFDYEGYTFSNWTVANKPAQFPITVTGNMAIKANFTKNKSDIYFWIDQDAMDAEDTENGLVIPVIEDVEYGSDISTYVPVDPTKTGYEFLGWDMEAITMEATDMHFVGLWEIESYDVTFDVDGNKMPFGEIEYNADVVSPTPTKEGYTFTGWSGAGIAAGTTGTFKMPDIGNTGDAVTYTATWDANDYELTWKFADDVTADKTETVEFGTVLSAPAVPDRVGYTFSGWMAEDGSMLVAGSTTMPAKNTTYTAQWTEAGGIKYVINTYIMNTSGEYGDPSTVTKYDGVTNELIDATPTIVSNGFALDTDHEGYKASGNVAADGSLVLNVYIERLKFNFKATADGATVANVDYYYGATVSAPAVPAKTGYTGKWDAEVPATMPANNVTLTAVYSINSYKVNYVVDGKPYGESVSAEYNSDVTVIAAPTKEGYTFSGWDKTGTFKMPANDVTISGTFTVNTHNVIYKVDGAEYETVENVAYGTNVTVIAAPTKEGYTFSGWDKTGTFAMPDADVTISGTFTVNTHNVIYKVDGAEYETVENVAFGTDVTVIAAPTKEGYTFSGWDKTGTFAMPDADVTISGTFTVNKHNVIYKVDGEVYKTVENVAFGTDVTVIAAPTKEGYTFSGWDKTEAFAMPDADVTISGTFNVNTHNVIYMIDGVEYQKVENVAFGTDVTVIAEPTEAGKTFSGWSKTGTFSMPDEDVIITGSWAANDYTVTYYAADKKTVVYTCTAKYGQEYNVPTANAEGYTFNGWLVLGTDAESGLEAGSIVTVTANAEYYADMTVNKYPLVYRTYNGVYAEYKDDNAVAYGTAKADWPVPAENPTRPGHTFGGWNYTETTMPARQLVVTANWNAIPYTVTWINNGASVVDDYIYGETIVAPDAGDNEGYTFEGWLEADGTTYFMDGDVMGENSLVYTAVWTPNSDVAYEIYRYFAPVTGTEAMDPDEAYAKYGKLGVEAKEGTAGETASVDVAAEAVEGFTIDTENSVLSAPIAGNGSTDLVIYYTRNTYKLTTSANNVEETVPYLYEAAVATPAVPTMTGYTFAGWDVAVPATMPAKDVKLFATWDAIEFTFIFNDENGAQIGEPVKADFGTAIAAPTAPVKEGYTFAYWVDEETGEVMPDTAPAKNATYKPVYTAGENVTYYIEVYMMDTNGEYVMSSSTEAYGTTGDPISIKPGAVAGCTYDAELSKLTGVITGDGKATLKVYYARDKYTVTFNAADGAFADNATVVGPTDVYYGAAIPTPAAPAREGYTFAGWDVEVPATMPAENLTFNATWAEADYTITYIINGDKKVETYKFGDTITKPADPVVTGMTFVCWDEEIPATMPAENLIFIAEFEVSVYTVTFVVEGTVFDKKSIKAGDEIVVPDATPTKEFFTFTGWNLPNGGIMPASDIEVTANFERIPVKLIPMAGSTTVIDDENKVIYGLELYADEDVLRTSYLDIEGDGYYVIKADSRFCGTGTEVEVYDNYTGAYIDTYTIVIFGDLNGDARINNTDIAIAQDEADRITSWSNEASSDYDFYKTMAADFNGDGRIASGEAASIERATLGTVEIDQTTGEAIRKY